MKRFDKILDYTTIIGILIVFEIQVIDSIIDKSDNWLLIILFLFAGVSAARLIWRLFKRNNYTLD